VRFDFTGHLLRDELRGRKPVKPVLGMGLAFREVKPNFRSILQMWILAAIHDRQTTEQSPV
jgi:hypothetical protein